jgi:hypothetical protein
MVAGLMRVAEVGDEEADALLRSFVGGDGPAGDSDGAFSDMSDGEPPSPAPPGSGSGSEDGGVCETCKRERERARC